MSVPTGSTSLASESIIPTSFSSVISATPTSFISNATSSFITSSIIESPSSTSSIPEATPTKTDVIDTIRETAMNPSDLGSQFTICICAGILIFLIFCFTRTRAPVLFAPRRNMKRHKPPELPGTIFGWIVPLLKIGDEEMLENVGLDALLMLKFITMCIKIFSICTVLGLVVFIPITMTADSSHLTNTTAIDRVSIAVIQEDDNKLIAYLIFSYIFTFITFFFLNKSYHEYIYLRSKFLLKQAKMMVSRSIVVTGIPQHLRSDQALSEYYENLEIGPVESCYVVREVHRLNTMIKKRAQALIKLEEAYATYWGNPCKIPGYDPDRILDDVQMYKKVLDLAEKRTGSSTDDSSEEEPGAPPKLRKKKKPGNTTFFKGLVEPKLALKKQIQKSRRPTVRVGGIFGLFGTKVDAIEYYTKLFDDLDKTVSERRKSPNFEMSNVAFVTFEHMSSAIIASQIAINPEPFNCRASMACEPRDVLWDSVAIRGRERILREVVVWSITVFLCLTWTIPVAAISTLFSLKAIAKIDSNLGDILDQSEIGHMIFGSFVPTIILNIVTSVLPIFFDTMGYYQGLRSRSAVAESTLSKYYFFLVSLTLIFYSITGTITVLLTVITDLSKNLQDIPTYVANSLSKLAPFFINYTILQAFLIMPLNILLLGSIIIRGFYHLFICSTPREHAENRAPWAFNYGIGYPAPLLIFTIVFEYSLINPVILLFGTVYFCFTYVVYKYQFLYVYFRPYEAAGRLWTMVIPRIIFTLILFQLTMIGLFLLKKAYILGGLCVPLIGITFLFRFLLNKAYEENGRNLPMQLLRDNLKELPNGSENDSDSEDDSSDDDSLMSRSKSEADIEDEKAKEAKMAARNRWKKAAHSAANLKEEPKTEDKSIIIRPRHRKLVLDEDDYEATPDRLTDYRQPPMQLNPGLLDAGLKRYGNPLLVGVLPQLWLPVKVPVEGEQKRSDHNRRKSDLLHNRVSGGGNLAQHLAEILRKVEADNKAEEDLRLQTESSQGLTSSKQPSQQDDIARAKLIENSKKIAQSDAASIVQGKPSTKIKVLRTLFKNGALKKSNLSEPSITSAEDFKMKHIHDDDTLDSAEKGQRSTDAVDDHSSTSSKSVHHTYYHHPERRKSNAFTNNHLPLPIRPEYRQSRLSAPAVIPDMDDNETIAADIIRPDTQNSRHSSAPLLNKTSKKE